MKERKKNCAYSRDNGQKNQTGTVFIFSHRNYPGDKRDQHYRDGRADGHIPPSIAEIKYI